MPKKKGQKRPKKSQFYKLDFFATFQAGRAAVYSYAATGITSASTYLKDTARISLKKLSDGIGYLWTKVSISERTLFTSCMIFQKGLQHGMLGAGAGCFISGFTTAMTYQSYYSENLTLLAAQTSGCYFNLTKQAIQCLDPELGPQLTLLAENKSLEIYPQSYVGEILLTSAGVGAVLGISYPLMANLAYKKVYRNYKKDIKEAMRKQQSTSLHIAGNPQSFFTKIGSNNYPHGKVHEFCQYASLFAGTWLINEMLNMTSDNIEVAKFECKQHPLDNLHSNANQRLIMVHANILEIIERCTPLVKPLRALVADYLIPNPTQVSHQYQKLR